YPLSCRMVTALRCLITRFPCVSSLSSLCFVFFFNYTATTEIYTLSLHDALPISQEAVQNQNEPQLRDENAHNDKSVHGVLNPTYQAGLRRDAVQPDIEAERKKRDEIEAGKSYCSRRFGGATCDDKSAQIYAR